MIKITLDPAVLESLKNYSAAVHAVAISVAMAKASAKLQGHAMASLNIPPMSTGMIKASLPHAGNFGISFGGFLKKYGGASELQAKMAAMLLRADPRPTSLDLAGMAFEQSLDALAQHHRLGDWRFVPRDAVKRTALVMRLFGRRGVHLLLVWGNPFPEPQPDVTAMKARSTKRRRRPGRRCRKK